MSNDHQLATCIAIANQEEVAIAQFAQERTQNGQVREFAQMLQKDHSELLAKLKEYAPEATADGFLNGLITGPKGARQTRRNIDPAVRVDGAKDNADKDKGTLDQPSDANRDLSNRDSANRNTNSPNTRSTTAGAKTPISPISLEQEVAQECIDSAEKKLSEKSGPEFDKCFIGLQIAMHEAMKSKLTVYQRHASGNLAALLADAEKTTSQHLKQAEDLMEQLSKDAGTKTAK